MTGHERLTDPSGVRHGAAYLGAGRTRFSVWAPRAERVELVVGEETLGPLGTEHQGYHVGVFPLEPGARYRYLLDGRGPFADPASRSQPDGVHGPSQVVAPLEAEPPPTWRGLPLASQVICEIHVGTFSEAGTFEAVTAALPELAGAGYTTIELMPVAAFPGERNWGYDGVFPFAVHPGYGGRDSLARCCAEAHRLGLAVLLDVVYNHLGPEGAVFEEYGPYLTDRYRTPWGSALNFDGHGSDQVRRFFVEHALHLVRELGADGLRLDAVHEIPDQTASPFLAELADALHAEGRRQGRLVTLVAESPANDPRLVAVPEAGGVGMDGVWNDDFHHALRVALTGEQDRYFGDYRGVPDLATACTAGFVATGREVPSRGRRHGAPLRSPLVGDRLVVFAQNHDQIGNGGYGRRLASSLPLAAQFPVTALVCCSGFVPLRFMGEEYGETAPFHYFTDHSDPALAGAVRDGRQAEVGQHPELPPPDPQDPATFAASRLDRSLAGEGAHAELLAWQRALLRLRRAEPALGSLEPDRSSCWFSEEAGALVLLRRADPYLGGRPVVLAANLSSAESLLEPPLLADCRLDLLAVHQAGALSAGDRVTPGPDGRIRLRLDPYGVLLAALREPARGHWPEDTGTRPAAPARPPLP